MFRRWLKLTTTTSPCAARLAPSFHLPPPEPAKNPPPWHQTITDRLADASAPGVQTFRTRQSSDDGTYSAAPSIIAMISGLFIVSAAVPNAAGADGLSVAVSRTPAQGAGGRGGMKRPAP